MNKPRAHVSREKKKEVEVLKKLLIENEVIGVLDLTNLPSAQFQKLKNKLKDTISMRVSKKSLIKIAIESSKENRKGLEKLEQYLENCIPAILVSKEDPFQISKRLNRNKSNLAAKPGQISPKDIKIPEGPTSFPAGPVVGELGAAGIKAAIEDGKVVVKQAKTIVKAGDIIDKKVSDLLVKFKIEPMEIGLNLIAVYQNGDVLTKEVLSIDEDKVLENIKTIAVEAFNLAIFSEYPTKDTVEILLKNAEAESVALFKKIPENDVKEETKKKDEVKEKSVGESKLGEEKKENKEQKQEVEEKQIDETSDGKKGKTSQSENQSDKQEQKGPSDYNEEDAKKAQEIINKMKDSNGG